MSEGNKGGKLNEERRNKSRKLNESDEGFNNIVIGETVQIEEFEEVEDFILAVETTNNQSMEEFEEFSGEQTFSPTDVLLPNQSSSRGNPVTDFAVSIPFSLTSTMLTQQPFCKIPNCSKGYLPLFDCIENYPKLQAYIDSLEESNVQRTTKSLQEVAEDANYIKDFLKDQNLAIAATELVNYIEFIFKTMDFETSILSNANIDRSYTDERNDSPNVSPITTSPSPISKKKKAPCEDAVDTNVSRRVMAHFESFFIEISELDQDQIDKTVAILQSETFAQKHSKLFKLISHESKNNNGVKYDSEQSFLMKKLCCINMLFEIYGCFLKGNSKSTHIERNVKLDLYTEEKFMLFLAEVKKDNVWRNSNWKDFENMFQVPVEMRITDCLGMMVDPHFAYFFRQIDLENEERKLLLKTVDLSKENGLWELIAVLIIFIEEKTGDFQIGPNVHNNSQ